MKKESKLRIICLVAALLIIAHFCYYAFFRQIPLLPILIMVGGWSPNMVLYALLESKKVRDPDYSKILNFMGILIAVCSLGIYFSYFLGVWQSNWIAYSAMFIVLGYAILLTWYKGRFWS